MSSAQLRVGKLAAKNCGMASQFLTAVRSLQFETTTFRRGEDDDYGSVTARRGVPSAQGSDSESSVGKTSRKKSILSFRLPSKGSVVAARPNKKDVTLFYRKSAGTLPFHPSRGEVRNQFTTRSYSSTDDDLAHKVSLEIQNDLMPLDDSTRKMLSFKSPSASRIRKSEENIGFENLGLNPTRYKQFISENMLNMKAGGVQKQQLGFSRRMEHRSSNVSDGMDRGRQHAAQPSATSSSGSLRSNSASRDYSKYEHVSYDRTPPQYSGSEVPFRRLDELHSNSNVSTYDRVSPQYSGSEVPFRRLDELHSNSNIATGHYSASQRAVIDQRESILAAKRNAIKEPKKDMGFKPVKFEMPKGRASVMNHETEYDYDNKFQEIIDNDKSKPIQAEKNQEFQDTNTKLKYSKQSATNFQAGQGRAPPRRVYSTDEHNNWGFSPHAYGESGYNADRRSSPVIEEAWSLPRRSHSVPETTEVSQNNRSHSVPSRTREVSPDAESNKQNWQYSNKSAVMHTAGQGRVPPQRVFLPNEKSYTYNSHYKDNLATKETAAYARNEPYVRPHESSMSNEQLRNNRNLSTATKIRSVSEPQKPMYKIQPIEWYNDDEDEPMYEQRGEMIKSNEYNQHEDWHTDNARNRGNNREQRDKSYYNSGDENNYSDTRTAYRNELINAPPEQYWRAYDS